MCIFPFSLMVMISLFMVIQYSLFFLLSINLSISSAIFFSEILAYAKVTPKKLFEDMDKYIEATKDLKLVL